MHFGTSAYVGLGVSMEETERHLSEAQAAGADMLFTSMQLPESDVQALHRDMPRLTRMAHSFGMKVDADVAPRTMERFGIGRMDARAFREFGLDVIRLDYGYSLEETVELTHNTQGLTVELNATIPADKQKENLEMLKRAGARMDRLRACHNYYPKAHTGLPYREAVKMNALLHEYGLEVGGFVASRTHKRYVVGDGLPTLERHRQLDVFTQAQECALCGMDFVFIGDDLAAMSELEALASVKPGVIQLRIEPAEESEALKWILNRPFRKADLAEELLRAGFGEERPDVLKTYTGNIHEERRVGDVTIDLPSYYRYAGEVNIVLSPLPKDERIALLGRIVESDVRTLELLDGGETLMLVRV